MIVKETVVVSGTSLLANNFPSSFFYTGILREIRYRPESSKAWPTTDVALRVYRTTSTGGWNRANIWRQCVPGASEVSFFPKSRVTTTTTETADSRYSSQFTDILFVDQKFLVRISTCKAAGAASSAVNCFLDLYFDGLQYRSSERGARIRNQTSSLNL